MSYILEVRKVQAESKKMFLFKILLKAASCRTVKFHTPVSEVDIYIFQKIIIQVQLGMFTVDFLT